MDSRSGQKSEACGAVPSLKSKVLLLQQAITAIEPTSFPRHINTAFRRSLKLPPHTSCPTAWSGLLVGIIRAIVHYGSDLPRLEEIEEGIDICQVLDLVGVSSRNLEHSTRADGELGSMYQNTYSTRDADNDLQ